MEKNISSFWNKKSLPVTRKQVFGRTADDMEFLWIAEHVDGGFTDEVLFKISNIDIADIEKNEHMTALHKACMNGNAKNIKTLLEKRADINQGDLNGRTALHWFFMYLNRFTELSDQEETDLKKIYNLLKKYKANLDILDNEKISPRMMVEKMMNKTVKLFIKELIEDSLYNTCQPKLH